VQKLRPILTLIALVLALALGLAAGFVLTRLLGHKGPRFLDTATILRQVQTVSQLVTVKYVMEKVVVLEDVKWYGDNRVLLVAHGVVKAGVDLGRLEEGDIQVHDKTISVRLPPPQITDAFLDDNQTRVIERSTGLLRLFDKDLEQTARQNAVDDIRRAARVSGILKDAEERAQSQLRALFLQMGFAEVEFSSR
jgi:hypothetical protein